MPFDPTFPPHGVGLVSADWRTQFNGLKDLIDTLTNQMSDVQGENDALQDQVTALQTELALGGIL